MNGGNDDDDDYMPTTSSDGKTGNAATTPTAFMFEITKDTLSVGVIC
jgi:hypothetical protein